MHLTEAAQCRDSRYGLFWANFIRTCAQTTTSQLPIEISTPLPWLHKREQYFGDQTPFARCDLDLWQ